MESNRKLPTLIGLTAIALISSNAMAANRIFPLHLQNMDSQPITFEIVSTGPCYEGTPGKGEQFRGIAPGSRVTITLARIQGNNCDGKGGELGIKFTPGDGHREIQNFQFDNAGSLWLMPGANTYPGRLSAKARDESYTYTTIRGVVKEKVTAGKAVGSWANLCMGICNQSTAETKSKEIRKETTLSEEAKQAVSLSLTAGVEVSAGIAKASASTTVTGSTEKTIGRSMNEAFTNGETFTNTNNAVFTPEQQREFSIRAVWQWVAITRLSTGEAVTVRSNRYAGTSGGTPPNQLPESDEALASCSGGLVRTAEPAPVARPAPVAQPAPAPIVALAPTQPSAPAVTTAPAKGQNVTAIEFGHLGPGGARLGHYRQTGPREWSEIPTTGPIVFRFEETQRDEWSVYMVDRSRGVNVQLDLYTRKIMYSDARQPRRELYSILGASAAALP